MHVEFRYKMDLHVHTEEVSRCGNVGAAEVVARYRLAGYQGLVITDHYYKMYFDKLGDLSWEEKMKCFLTGYHVAKEAGEKLGMTILLGMEIKFDEDPNDYLVYGFDEGFLIEHPYLNELSVEEFVVFARKYQLMIVQAHPFRKGMTQQFTPLLDGVEIYNGNRRHQSRNHMAKELQVALGLLGISGSDFHETEDLALGGVAFQKKITDMHQLIDTLKNQDFVMIEEGVTVNEIK